MIKLGQIYSNKNNVINPFSPTEFNETKYIEFKVNKLRWDRYGHLWVEGLLLTPAYCACEYFKVSHLEDYGFYLKEPETNPNTDTN